MLSEKTVWHKLEIHRDGVLRKPVLLVSVSTSIPQYRPLYSHARELASYMLNKMKFEPLASMYSSALPPEVEIREDGTVSLAVNHFYLNQGKRDIVLFAGDSSPFDDQYEFTDAVLSFAKRLGVREMFSVGTRWSEAPPAPSQTIEVMGFATDQEGVEELKSNGVKLIRDEPAPFFASMVVGLAKEYGMRGYKVSVNHGEPIPHASSVAKMLGVLSKMIGFQIDLAGLQPADDLAPSPQPGGADVYR